MSTRKGLALAAFLAVGSVALSPLASRAQFLAGQAAAAGIQGDLAGRAGANGLTAAERARAQLAAANDRGRAADQFSEEAASPTGGSELSRALESPQALKRLQGQATEIYGQVIMNMQVMGQKMSTIQPHPSMGLPPEVALFLISGKEIPVGTTIRTRATLQGGKTQNGMFGLLFTGPGQNLAAAAAPDPSPRVPAPEAPAAPMPAGPDGFAEGLTGWRLAGVVDIEKGTCLFLDDQGQPKFLQPGEQLEAGVFLKKVEGQDVTLQVDGKDLEISVW